MVSRTFTAPCVYSKFGHHPHTLGYLCAELVNGEKLRIQSLNQSLTHSLTHPAYLMLREPKRLRFGITNIVHISDMINHCTSIAVDTTCTVQRRHIKTKQQRDTNLSQSIVYCPQKSKKINISTTYMHM